MDRFLARILNVETERLHLRPFGLADAAIFQAMTNEPETLNVVHFLTQPFRLPDAEKLLVGDGAGGDCFWGAWYRNSRTLIGSVGTPLKGAEEIEVGYWFATHVHG